MNRNNGGRQKLDNRRTLMTIVSKKLLLTKSHHIENRILYGFRGCYITKTMYINAEQIYRK